MTPVPFPEQSDVLGRPPTMTDEECRPLPVFRDGVNVVSCWRPSWRERLSILFFGRVWLALMSGTTQPPAYVAGQRTYLQRSEP